MGGVLMKECMIDWHISPIPTTLDITGQLIEQTHTNLKI